MKKYRIMHDSDGVSFDYNDGGYGFVSPEYSTLFDTKAEAVFMSKSIDFFPHRIHIMEVEV